MLDPFFSNCLFHDEENSLERLTDLDLYLEVEAATDELLLHSALCDDLTPNE
jgi:hypothetical protein